MAPAEVADDVDGKIHLERGIYSEQGNANILVQSIWVKMRMMIRSRS
jgi:hypothetical protein